MVVAHASSSCRPSSYWSTQQTDSATNKASVNTHARTNRPQQGSNTDVDADKDRALHLYTHAGIYMRTYIMRPYANARAHIHAHTLEALSLGSRSAQSVFKSELRLNKDFEQTRISAGTGKSFLLTTVYLYCLVHGKRCRAAAPTGIAASTVLGSK